jgi:hypothetical protein
MLAALSGFVLLSFGVSTAVAQSAASPSPSPSLSASPATAAESPGTPAEPSATPVETLKLSNAQLDSLVAPVALYPDPLLAQTLAASTYPLEVVQIHQWLGRNKKLKEKALVDEIGKQPWESSVQAMAAYPEALQRMAENIQWASELGNAFLAQPADVMDAVQRMRAKAEAKGTLESGWAQKVEKKKTEGGKDVIVIEPADPEVLYVPSYDLEYVYGDPGYPWYPYYYPYYGGYWWGAGAIIGGIWGGWWGDCDWGNGDIDIDIDNNFNRPSHPIAGGRPGRPGGPGGIGGPGRPGGIGGPRPGGIGGPNRPGAGGPPGLAQPKDGNRLGGGKWQHRPEHRGNAPYADKRTADRFGNKAQQRPARDTASRPAKKGDKSAKGSGAKRSGAKGSGRKSVSTRPASKGKAGAKSSSARATSARSSSGSRTGGSSRVGTRSVSSQPSYSNRGGTFGGSTSGNRNSFNSSRGGYSTGGGGFSRGGYGGGGFSGGGGGFRGGGGRGGGGRGGGGGRRR